MNRRMAQISLTLAFVCLPLGAAACELSAAWLCLAAICWGDRRNHPMVIPVLAVWIAWTIPSLDKGIAGWFGAVGQTWPLILLIAIPPLQKTLRGDPQFHEQLERWGLFAGSVIGIWAMGSLLGNGIPPWEQPASGPFSHNLTLGYALLPPLALAVHRSRWLWASCIAGGVLSAGASGPVLGLAMIMATRWIQPKHCLIGGVGLALTILWWMGGSPELTTRMVHWTAGVQVVFECGFGCGPTDTVSHFQDAERLLSATIGPERHAHDSVLQWAMMGGAGAWLAWALLLTLLWQHTGKSGRAAIAALGVGALTQDVFGDLEVIRALCAWALLDSVQSNQLGVSDLDPSGYAEGALSSVSTSKSC